MGGGGKMGTRRRRLSIYNAAQLITVLLVIAFFSQEGEAAPAPIDQEGYSVKQELVMYKEKHGKQAQKISAQTAEINSLRKQFKQQATSGVKLAAGGATTKVAEADDADGESFVGE